MAHIDHDVNPPCSRSLTTSRRLAPPLPASIASATEQAIGFPVDLIPYAPPLDESVYPYYPFHANKDALVRLLRDHTVLVLPNVSGFQQTDSDLIKAFLEEGGVIVAFGPQIPMGRSYER